MFDGVHIGHRHLLAQLKREAAGRGLATAVVTFREHPTRLLTPDCPVQLITTPEERMRLIRREGIDHVVMFEFNEQLRCLSSHDFMMMLHDDYGVDCLVVGFNHRFGSDRNHSFSDYRRIGAGIGIDVVSATEVEGVRASSSIIRRLITMGQVEKAAALLGRNCTVEGKVVSGRQLGRTIGFPTANVMPAGPDLLIPGPGVYAARVMVDGTSRNAMVNIGWRPTVNTDSNDVSIEAHLLDFEGVLYGKDVKVVLCARLRDEHRFMSVEALRQQLIEDVKSARKVLSGHILRNG